MQCQGRAQRAAKQLSVEEDGEGVRSARRVPSGRGQGRAPLALGETHLCSEGSGANWETGPGREGRLPV